MRLSLGPLTISVSFDDSNLVSRAGLVPVMGLAGRAGLLALSCEHARIGVRCGANAAAKVGCLVAGMAADADCFDDMDILRHGAMGELFDGIRAPSTLGSFLRAFTWGNVRQLEKVSRLLLAELARQPLLLPGADRLAFAGHGLSQRRVYGHARQARRSGTPRFRARRCLCGAERAYSVRRL